jgi:hypothetical protein
VTVAVCTVRGTVKGPAVQASARIIAAEQLPQIWALLRAKYGWQLRATTLSSKLNTWLRRTPRKPTAQVYLELTPAAT